MKRVLKPRVFKKGEKQSTGRGFSRGELKKAGTNHKEALKLGIPLDSRRRTVHEENVTEVKAFLKNISKKSKPKRKSKS